MSVNYNPIDGTFGKIKFTLYDTSNTVVSGYDGIEMYVFDYEDYWDDSKHNDFYEALDGDLIPNYVGKRFCVKFNLINARAINLLDANNLENIIKFTQAAQATINGLGYRLKIQTKRDYFSDSYVQNDHLESVVLFNVLFGVKKFNDNYDIAQIIPIELKSRTMSQSGETISFYKSIEPDSIRYVQLENGDDLVQMENDNLLIMED